MIVWAGVAERASPYWRDSGYLRSTLTSSPTPHPHPTPEWGDLCSASYVLHVYMTRTLHKSFSHGRPFLGLAPPPNQDHIALNHQDNEGAGGKWGSTRHHSTRQQRVARRPARVQEHLSTSGCPTRNTVRSHWRERKSTRQPDRECSGPQCENVGEKGGRVAPGGYIVRKPHDIQYLPSEKTITMWLKGGTPPQQ